MRYCAVVFLIWTSLGWIGCSDSERSDTKAVRNGAAMLPAHIEAEDFSSAIDLSVGNAGLASCTQTANPNVDLGVCSDNTGCGCSIGWAETGDVLDYFVINPQSGESLYDIDLRIASAQPGAMVRIEMPPGVIRGRVSADGEGYQNGWQSWVTRKLDKIPVPPGQQTLRLVFEGPVNLNYLDVKTPADSSNKPSDPQLPPSSKGIHVAGRQVLIDGQPLTMKAVCWNPVRQGQRHPEGLMFLNPSDADLQLIERDLRLMREMGANTIRTYEAILDPRVLALVQQYGFRMIVPVLNYYATPEERIRMVVERLKDHPATLFWELGNEWNYNHLYSTGAADIGLEGAKSLIKKTATLIRALDTTHPISSVHGELPSAGLIAELNNVDVWGLNIYSGLSFGDRFKNWQKLSGKPMYIGEYGADAVNRTVLDTASQARAVAALSTEILQNLAARSPSNATLGGAVFEWNDEWWKDGKGSPAVQDIGGIAPGGGPYPDSVFNEEWWGLVDINRIPRPAYTQLKEIWTQVP